MRAAATETSCFGETFDELDVLGLGEHEVAALAAADEVGHELVVAVDLGVRLGDRVLALLHGGEIDHLVAHPAARHAPVGALDEAVLVDPRVGGKRVDEADVGAFRGLDRTDAAVVRRVHVAHLEAGALAREPARAQGREAPLVRDLRERVGLVHELAELRGAEKLAHRGRRRLGVDQVVRHHGVDLDRRHALADRALHAQEPDPVLILHELADRADAPVAQMVDVVDLAAPVLEVDQHLDDGEDVLLAQHAHGIRAVELEAHVHLDAADGREVVALRIEEEALEERLRRIERWRLARAHHAIDVDERLLAGRVLVDRERVADVGADVDVVDREGRQLRQLVLLERLERIRRHFLAGLDQHEPGLLVDQVLGHVAAVELLRRHQHFLGTPLDDLAAEARRHLGAGLGEHLLALGVDEVGIELDAAHALRVEGHLPALRRLAEQHLAVEVGEDLLGRHAGHLVGLDPLALGRARRAQLLRLEAVEAHEECGHRQLAPAVDAHVDEVLGVELEIEPGAAVGDDARGEKILARAVRLALVVVEEHAGRAVHLGDDDALGAVDDEGAVRRHERHVAHVDILLLDVADGARAGLLVDVPHHEAQRHLEGGRVGHAALLTLLDVVLRLLELVLEELELGALREIPDREDRLEDLLEPEGGTLLRHPVLLQKLVVGVLLHLDQVRHRGDLGNAPEVLANALATGE